MLLATGMALLTISCPSRPMEPRAASTLESSNNLNLSRDVIPPGQCPSWLPDRPLEVLDVVDRAICSSPQERRAREAYLAQIAQMKMRADAYWPTVSARMTLGASESFKKVRDFPLFDSNVSALDKGGAIDFQLPLIDFGRRRSNLDQAKKLVAAAGADYDSTIQQIMLSAVEIYYEAVDAKALLAAAQRSEESAQLILEIAEGRFAGGVGVVTDQLMAQTTRLQSSATRTFAEGRLASALGVLALTMGIEPTAEVEIAATPEEVPVAADLDAVGEVLDRALASSSQVQAARARLAAAESAVGVAESIGNPSIDLVAGAGKSKTAYGSAQQDFGLYDPPGDSSLQSWNVQLRLTVPVFSGFSRSNAIGDAIAQVNMRRAELMAAERVVSQEVWQSYQMAVSQLKTLRLTFELLGVARESVAAATFRYEAGSGTMVEVLNAQTALTNVEQRRVEAFSNWRAARIRLALRMGMEEKDALAY